jgi:hypothetical protein
MENTDRRLPEGPGRTALPFAHPDVGADIAMCRQNCESASEMILVLFPEEAKAPLGLHALRNDPEAPDNL